MDYLKVNKIDTSNLFIVYCDVNDINTGHKVDKDYNYSKWIFSAIEVTHLPATYK